jgi:hypothetical protein
MRTCILVKLFFISVLINYTLATTLSGKCLFEDKKVDCKIKSTEEWQVEVTGAGSNFPSYNYNGEIKLPYAFIENVTQQTEYANWLIFSFPYTVLRFNMNKYGLREILTFEMQGDFSASSAFINEIGVLITQRRNILQVQKNKLISLVATYNTRLTFLDSNKDSYNSDSSRISFLNSEIVSKTNTLTSSITQKNILEIENNKLQPSVATKITLRSQASKVVSECRAYTTSVGDMLKTYEKYNREFNDEEVSQFLDKEYSNLCLFHLAAQDLAVIMPNQIKEINKARKEIANNRNIEPIRDLFNSDEFYILRDFN